MPRRGLITLALGLLGASIAAAPAAADHPNPEGGGLLEGPSILPASSLNMELIGNSPKPGTTNSDLAFWGDLAYSGNYNGFRIVDVSDRSNPRQIVDYPCYGPQNDVGVWDARQRGNGDQRLLFLSVDSGRPDDRCENRATGELVAPRNSQSEGEFEGIRVFDVTDPDSPEYLTAVTTDCGSHTHTVIPADRDRRGRYEIDSRSPDRVLIYVSSYPLIDQDDDCGALNVGSDPTHNKISIVEVPFDAPENAYVLKEEPLDPTTRAFPDTSNSRGCHDIGAFLPLEIAAGACQSQGYLWDISNPADPKMLISEGAKRIQNPSINYWHSASFTWDGEVMIFGDEEGGAAVTHGCFNALPTQPATGATWFYERDELTPGDNVAQEDGSFTQTREQFTQGETTCTAHNYTPIPVEDRYLMISAYYQAGTSMIDLTQLSNPQEVAYYDSQGGEEGNPERADTWSSYWYNGNPFGNDINRGLDVFRVLNEPARMVRGARRFDHLNPQTQELILRD
jgi:hypothetical protein